YTLSLHDALPIFPFMEQRQAPQDSVIRHHFIMDMMLVCQELRKLVRGKPRMADHDFRRVRFFRYYDILSLQRFNELRTFSKKTFSMISLIELMGTFNGKHHQVGMARCFKPVYVFHHFPVYRN